MNIEDREFDQICNFMHRNYGINLTKKRSLIEGRLSQVISSGGYPDFKAYTAAVIRDEHLQQQMVTRLTTNFTFFQRESMHYDYMVKDAVPALFRASPHKSSLKLWSAGCSSGDEAYTASIYLREMALFDRRAGNYLIHATDISDKVLEQAKSGCFSDDSLKNVSPEIRRKYFASLPDGRWKVSPLIADSVRFSKLNLMEHFPPTFRNFDIIFCRNVMIYFTSETRESLARKYYDALAPGGYLFIGMSETIPAARIGFQVMRPSVFRKEG